MSKEDWGFVLLLLALAACIAAEFMQPEHFKKIMYDCRVAEISPDVPPKVKEECRKLQEGKH